MIGNENRETTFYELLGVKPGANIEEIHAAFAGLIRKHRERPGDRDPQRSNRARQINLAYATLGNARTRQAYDESIGVADKLSTPYPRPLSAFLPARNAVQPGPEVKDAKVARASDSTDPSAVPLDPLVGFLLGPPNDRRATAVRPIETGISQPEMPHVADIPVERRKLDEEASGMRSRGDRMSLFPTPLWADENMVSLPKEPSEALQQDQVPADSAAREDPAAWQDRGHPSIAARDWDKRRRSWVPVTLGLAALAGTASLLVFDAPQILLPPASGDPAAARPAGVAGSPTVATQSGSQAGAVTSQSQIETTLGATGSLANASGARPGESSEQALLAVDDGEGQNAASDGSEQLGVTEPAQSTDISPVVVAVPEISQRPITIDPPAIPVQQPPRAAPAKWAGGALLDSDNPRGRFEGAVAVRFRVLPNGRVAGCSPIRSSGNAALDATTCRLVEQRLRFAPATNDEGRPVESQVTTTYTWGRRRGH